MPIHRSRSFAVLTVLLFATIAQGQWVEDSVYVGGGWIGGMAYNPRADVVYGASEAGLFFAIACSTNEVVSSIPLRYALHVAYDSTDNKAYCTFYNTQEDDSVLVVDGVTHQRIKAIPVDWATCLVWDPVSNRLFVSCVEEDEVAVIDCVTDSVIDCIRVGRSPTVMDLNVQGRRLYVRNRDSESVSIIDLETLENTETIRLSNVPEAGYYSEAADKYYCSSGRNVMVVDGAGDSVLTEIPLPHQAWAYSFAENPDLGLLLVGTSYINDSYFCAVRTATDSLVSEIPSPRGPDYLIWSQYSRQFYCVCTGPDVVAVVSSDGSQVVAEVPVHSYPAVLQLVEPWHRIYVGHHGSPWVYVIKDMVGIAEEPERTRPVHPAATLTRGRLRVAEQGRLYDTGGRQVCQLQRGENDVRHLAPGVYTVHTVTGALSRVVKVR